MAGENDASCNSDRVTCSKPISPSSVCLMGLSYRSYLFGRQPSEDTMFKCYGVIEFSTSLEPNNGATPTSQIINK